MSYTVEYLENKLREKLSAQYVHFVDESDGCGQKFKATIVAEIFCGKRLLDKHRLVNNVLAEELKKIHAFSQKTYTPEEWDKVCKETE